MKEARDVDPCLVHQMIHQFQIVLLFCASLVLLLPSACVLSQVQCSV